MNAKRGKPRKKIRRQARTVTGIRHKQNLVYGSKWRRIRPTILARDNWQCQVRSPVCQRKADRVDHVVDPVRDGGAPYAPENLRASCRACNAWRKQGKDLPERKTPERTRCPHRIGDKWCYELNLPGH
jgi:5-methylcytosine-specific restriction endonuclease McrA